MPQKTGGPVCSINSQASGHIGLYSLKTPNSFLPQALGSHVPSMLFPKLSAWLTLIASCYECPSRKQAVRARSRNIQPSRETTRSSVSSSARPRSPCGSAGRCLSRSITSLALCLYDWAGLDILFFLTHTRQIVESLSDKVLRCLEGCVALTKHSLLLFQ